MTQSCNYFRPMLQSSGMPLEIAASPMISAASLHYTLQYPLEKRCLSGFDDRIQIDLPHFQIEGDPAMLNEPHLLPASTEELPALEMRWILEGGRLRAVWTGREPEPFDLLHNGVKQAA